MPLAVKLNAVHVLALAAAGLALGEWLKRRVPVLERLCIPAPVAGGLVYAGATLILRDRWVNFEMDMVLREILMVAFFTSIGMNASWRVIRAGGGPVLLFLALATGGAVLQNLLGMGLAGALGLDPLLGIVSGSVALTGGPATSLAFGSTFEKLGVRGASTLGLASATFGITAAGILSGYIGARLIARRGFAGGAGGARRVAAVKAGWDFQALARGVVTMAIAMGIGGVLSATIEKTGAVLPSYIGAMIAAAALRNLDDRFGFAGVAPEVAAGLGNLALSLFIVMALLTLRLWELAHLALPLLAMLLAQVALVWLLCETVLFWAMGRDYESAVMASGYCGFMLGTTANAVASMDELAGRFGAAPQAFMVVPLVGGFLVDFTNAVVITAMANWPSTVTLVK